MLPFESLIPLALPIPLTVRPSRPPELVMLPVKVLAEAGFSTQTPPSFLAMFRTGVFVPVLLDSTIFIWLKSEFAPRRSNVTNLPAAPAATVFVKDPARIKAPEPEASIR